MEQLDPISTVDRQVAEDTFNLWVEQAKFIINLEAAKRYTAHMSALTQEIQCLFQKHYRMRADAYMLKRDLDRIAIEFEANPIGGEHRQR